MITLGALIGNNIKSYIYIPYSRKLQELCGYLEFLPCAALCFLFLLFFCCSVLCALSSLASQTPSSVSSTKGDCIGFPSWTPPWNFLHIIEFGVNVRLHSCFPISKNMVLHCLRSNDFSVIILRSLLSVLVIFVPYLQIYVLLQRIYLDYMET